MAEQEKNKASKAHDSPTEASKVNESPQKNFMLSIDIKL